MSGMANGAPLARHEKLPSLRDFDRGVLALASRVPDCKTNQDEALRSDPLNLTKAALPDENVWAYSSGTPRRESSLSAREAEGKYKAQRYTTEQSDFIIYCLHEQNRQWADICHLFARYFPHSPVRTMHGLQAIYYRSNKHVPACHPNGELIFHDEYALKPCVLHITFPKSRHRKRMEYRRAFGLAQRYPDRAMLYPWVDQVTRARASRLAYLRAAQWARRVELWDRSFQGSTTGR